MKDQSLKEIMGEREYEMLTAGIVPVPKREFHVVRSTTLYPEIENSKVLDTYINLEWLLAHFNAQIRYNLMSRRREVTIPGHFISDEDTENAALARVNYLATINGMPTKQLDKHLDAIAQKNPYHPIVECLAANPWDGVPRLQQFIETIQTTNDILAYPLIRTWMIAAVAAAHSLTGFKNEGVLVLQGKQNIGKTRWALSLDPINCRAVKESALLDPNQKDSVIGIARHWIVELGELDATFRKADIARLKAYISSRTDDMRFAYAARETCLPRRTAFIATVNDENFLADDTGNRRWWTITVQSINLNHNLNMVQVWAEVYALWQNGGLTYLDADLQEQVDISNIEHEKVDPLVEQLAEHYDWEAPAWHWMSASDVLLELGYRLPINRGDATRMGILLKELLPGKKRISRGHGQYQMPYFLPKK